jgi:hypothetical protein
MSGRMYVVGGFRTEVNEACLTEGQIESRRYNSIQFSYQMAGCMTKLMYKSMLSS